MGSGLAVNAFTNDDRPLSPDPTTTPTPEGGVVIDFDPRPPQNLNAPQDFNAELSSNLTEQELTMLGSEVYDATDRDEKSREPWQKAYARGLNLLGLTYEERTTPWQDACGAFHPLLLESVIRFQAQAMTDLFPASGPVKTEIIGHLTEEVERQADRIKRDMNWIATKLMRGFRDESELLLFNLPMAGTVFRTWYWDERYKRPCAEYTLPEHIVMPYSATSLETTDFTRILFKNRAWVEGRQQSGYFRPDVEVQDGLRETTVIAEEKDRIEGKTNTELSDREPLKLYERHMDWFFAWDQENQLKLPLPYLVTIDSGSRKVLSIRRNWRQDDPTAERVKWVVQHKYMPGFGAYGMGLINILGGLTESATSILRQLVDAGTLSNLPAGFKTKGMRTKDDSTPFAPGEWRDVDIGQGTLRDNILPLPYKEPSAVLQSLLANIVDEGRRIGSVADMKISDMSAQNMPVGTTLAIIERSMKVMSAVQARLYHSFGVEYQVLARIVKDYMGEVPYPFALDPRDEGATRAQDYDDRVDIVPVSDPNATTMAQRILINQAIIQLTSQAPEIYDKQKVHRSMIRSLGSEEADTFVPIAAEVLPRDPVTENMDLINGKPVRAGMEQDHEAHIAVHMAAIKDPALAKTLESNPNAPAIFSAANAHVQEHLAYLYRVEIERQLGVPLPNPAEPLPPDIEFELSQMVQKAAEKLLGQHEKEIETQEILDKLQDPIVQNETRRLEIDQQKADNQRDINKAKIADKERDREAKLVETMVREVGETARTVMTTQLQEQEIASREEVEGARLSAKIGTEMMNSAKDLVGRRVDRDARRAEARMKARSKPVK